MNNSFNFRTYHLWMMTLAFIAGILSSCSYALAALCAAISLSCIFRKKDIAIAVALFFSCFFCGSTRYHQQRAAYFSHHDLLEKKVAITGNVKEIMPRLDDHEQICIALQLRSISTQKKEYAVNKHIYIFVPHYSKIWLKPGQTIRIDSITLKHPDQGSYENYLMKEQIWAVAHLNCFSYTTCKKASLFIQMIDEIMQLPIKLHAHKLSDMAHTLYLSIFCGKKIKSNTTTIMKKLFSYWGISHHLARSGLHLIILIGLLLSCLSMVPCSASKKQWLIVLLLTGYFYTTFPSVAFVRAFIMYLLYTACKQLYLPIDPIHILLLTTLLVLLYNPLHIFFLDFQLSFSITLLMLWFLKITKNMKTIAS